MRSSDFGPYGSLVPTHIQDFQTWGIPERADAIHRKLSEGDWFILVGTIKGGGGVEYLGEVVHVIPTREPMLSRHLWTEARFPWIFLLQGRMQHVPWPVFLEKIGYAANFDPQGRVYGISKQKMRLRGYRTDYELIQAVEGSSL
jgi:hypothetical protein